MHKVAPLEEVRREVQAAIAAKEQKSPIEFGQVWRAVVHTASLMSRMYDNPNRETLTARQQAWLARMLEIAAKWGDLLAEKEQLSFRETDKQIGKISPKVAAMFEGLE